MVKMGHHRHIHAFGKMAEHRAQNRQRRVRTCPGTCLQDDRRTLCLGGHDKGAHILPAQTDQTRHGIAVTQRWLQHLGKRRQRHLNLATISMMPGMVCNCAAWVGWKCCFRLRWLWPPSTVK